MYTDAFLDAYFSKATQDEYDILPIVMLYQIVDVAFDVVTDQNRYRSFIRPFTARNITTFAVSYAMSRNEFVSNIPLNEYMREKIVWEIDRLLKFIKRNTQWEETLYKSLNNRMWFKTDA